MTPAQVKKFKEAELILTTLLKDGYDAALICAGLPARGQTGLCRLLRSCIYVPHFFEDWKYFSGDFACPVPCPNGQHPERAYIKARSVDSFYKGPYGELRLDLARHILSKIQTALEAK